MTAAPRRPLTLAEFWRRSVRDTTGRLVPHREQHRFIAAYDGGEYREYFLHWAKKTAKSFTAAAALTHHQVAGDEPADRRIAIASFGEDQSVEVVFRQHRQLVERDAWLSRRVKLYRGESVYAETCRDPRTGGAFKQEHVVRALARNLKVVHGEDWSFIVRDEYWTEPDHEYTEALIVSPNRRGGIIYLSYHAPRTMMRPAVPFFDLLQRAQAGDPTLFYSYIGGEGSDAAWQVARWVTRTWVEQQRKVFAASPSRFVRLVLNVAAPAGDTGLIVPEELRAALYTPPELVIPNPRYRYYCAADLGAVCDFTAVVVGHLEGAKLVVDHVRIWRGSRGSPVSFADVQQHLADLHDRYQFARVHLDAWQARLLAENLQRQGIDARIVALDGATIDRLVTRLKATFAQRQIKIPASAVVLVEQLESVQAVESRSRRDHLRFEPAESRGHDDAVVALAMLIDLVAASLGRARLPQFTCLKAAAQPSFDRSRCALFPSGLYRADDPICRSCEGWQAARSMWHDYLSSGAEPLDFWSYVQQHVELSERDQAAEWYRRCHEDEARAGEAYDRFVAGQRRRWC